MQEISAEERAPGATSDNSLTLLSLYRSDFLPDTDFHLTPSHLSPACPHTYNPTAVFLSIAKNKICDENFMLFGSGSSLSCLAAGNEVRI